MRKPARASKPQTGGELVARGKRVLALEAEAVQRLADRLSPAFAQAVEILKAAEGRVIVSGVGKSGLIARKIAATFTSTGTAATFLHPVDSLHGDLGQVSKKDVAILLSKSGQSDELFGLVSQLQRFGVPIIALTGDPTSPLAQYATVVLVVGASVSAHASCVTDASRTTVA